MSGWFLVNDGQVVWSHRHEHSGAHRRYEEIERVCAELAGRAR
jgi:hypothetical protein